MRILTKMLKQTAVYWPLGSAGYDNYGQPIPATPIEIRCRWEDVNEEYISSSGTREVSRAKVFVDRDVDVGGVLMLGMLTDVDDVNNPKANEGAWEIKRFDKIPTLKADQFLRRVFL